MIARLLAAPLFLAAAVFAADFSVSSPQINQCKPATFQIQGNWGANPHLSVLPSVDPCEHDSLVEIPVTIANGQFTWDSATVAAGTSVVVLIDDDSGHEAWSQTIVVGGSAADCPATTSSPSGSRPASTSSSASTRRPSTGTGSVDTPANAANAEDSSSSASVSARGTIGTVVVAFLSAVAFLA
ncbi:hypothetical protein FRB91_006920 [Serendipita sp. 411]|nr:hypothetical protein FRC16_010718 [Serendipita sp. 398]KAG8831741.1 hypothetical protein FRC18_006071 [Serendipita sp. 400]KAG8852161.1 hypothetical protein FRB91_006920 [Serendipita sp. 411]KAG8866092.1 hypothetical protein FRC20_009085 [Serendipita sp. 405]KAG9054165.1 hypothetical protein FS842_005914 [Serendipita sp. 407]